MPRSRAVRRNKGCIARSIFHAGLRHVIFHRAAALFLSLLCTASTMRRGALRRSYISTASGARRSMCIFPFVSRLCDFALKYDIVKEPLINSATHLHASALSSRRRQILDVAPLRLWFVSSIDTAHLCKSGRPHFISASLTFVHDKLPEGELCLYLQDMYKTRIREKEGEDASLRASSSFLFGKTRNKYLKFSKS